MFPSQNINELLMDIRGNKAMALFLGAGADFTNAYPDGEAYNGFRKRLAEDNKGRSTKLGKSVI